MGDKNMYGTPTGMNEKIDQYRELFEYSANSYLDAVNGEASPDLQERRLIEAGHLASIYTAMLVLEKEYAVPTHELGGAQ